MPYLVYASPVHSKKTQETSRLSTCVRKLQQRQRCVLIAVILRSFFGRIRQICARAAIAVTALDRYISERKGARHKVSVGVPHSGHSTLHNSFRRFGNVAIRCKLGKEVLGVSTYTRMLVRADDGYILFRVDTGIELGEVGKNGTPDASVPEGYV